MREAYDLDYIRLNFQNDYIRLPNERLVLGRDIAKYLNRDGEYVLTKSNADYYDYDLEVKQ